MNDLQSCYLYFILFHLRALYPGDSGYRFETGGRLGPLRTLTNEKIKQFHQKFYRLDKSIFGHFIILLQMGQPFYHRHRESPNSRAVDSNLRV